MEPSLLLRVSFTFIKLIFIVLFLDAHLVRFNVLILVGDMTSPFSFEELDRLGRGRSNGRRGGRGSTPSNGIGCSVGGPSIILSAPAWERPVVQQASWTTSPTQAHLMTTHLPSLQGPSVRIIFKEPITPAPVVMVHELNEEKLPTFKIRRKMMVESDQSGTPLTSHPRMEASSSFSRIMLL